MSVEEAKETLERLEKATGEPGRVHQPAPSSLIDLLHEALIPISSGEDRKLYRMDGLSDVDMDHLHSRVTGVLRDFERLVAEKQRQQGTSSN